MYREIGDTKCSKNEAASIPYLPHEIIMNILSRLPVKSILRFRSVCKLWCSLLNSPDFIMMHLSWSKDNPSFITDAFLKEPVLEQFFVDEEGKIVDRDIFIIDGIDGDAFSIMTSNSGLLCYVSNFSQDKRYHLIIYNPSTRESAMLPDGTPSSSPLLIGCGFDHLTREYKVVRIYGSTIEKNVKGCEVFTLGLDSTWREVGAAPFTSIVFEPVYVSGVVYWVEYLTGLIISFDLRDEKFQVMPFPISNLWSMYIIFPRMVEIRGWPSLIYMSNAWMEIWILKDPVNMTWTKEYSVEMSRLKGYCDEVWRLRRFKVIGARNNEILLVGNNGASYKLVSYNLQSQSLHLVDILPEQTVCVFVHVESLMSCKRPLIAPSRERSDHG